MISVISAGSSDQRERARGSQPCDQMPSFYMSQGLKKLSVKNARLVIHHKMAAFRDDKVRDIVCIQENPVGPIHGPLAKHVPLFHRQSQESLVEVTLATLFEQ